MKIFLSVSHAIPAKLSHSRRLRLVLVVIFCAFAVLHKYVKNLPVYNCV